MIDMLVSIWKIASYPSVSVKDLARISQKIPAGVKQTNTML